MLVVCGSARKDGDTGAAVERLRCLLPFQSQRINLSEKHIRPFDYARPTQLDDLDEIAAAMLGHHVILFATPVYWYAMSAQLKALFDRFSDLLSDRDPQQRGRGLAGKRLWLLAVGADPAIPPGFEVPFASTADYLDMRWRGSCYVTRGSADSEGRLGAFAARLAADLGWQPDRVTASP